MGGSGDDGRFHLAYNFTVGRLAEVIVTDTHGGGAPRLRPYPAQRPDRRRWRLWLPGQCGDRA